LLPIVRSTFAATLIVTAVLMVLSALGVKVAPLLAGAGVVGVAIGFGSQTLVRDLLSKFFYLLDDAFRIGEYIQSGNYKGTVEHLGVRSVRLRHHRGPLYTIPYGQLGAVQNASRDWVIDKMTLGLVYGTDLDKVKKVLKQIGKELSANPEFAPDILEPLKMQGVDQFGDFAIQVRLKMKTLPNKQFSIRRRAYAMIQKAFAENGIQFAFPTVQVAGQGDMSAAVAKQALDIAKSA
jgi:small-conductance mechanosensitive channel